MCYHMVKIYDEKDRKLDRLLTSERQASGYAAARTGILWLT